MAGRIAAMVVVLSIGLMASPAAAQSLGEVARKEAARREQLKTTGKAGSKVLTNADLPASAVIPPAGASAAESAAEGDTGEGEKAPAEAAATLAGRSGDAADKAEGAAASSDDEAGWRARAERVNGALAAAQTHLRQLKGLSDRLSLEEQASDPAIVARAQAERASLRAQIAAAEEKAAAALADRQALEQEARVAGVLPAWIQ